MREPTPDMPPSSDTRVVTACPACDADLWPNMYDEIDDRSEADAADDSLMVKCERCGWHSFDGWDARCFTTDLQCRPTGNNADAQLPDLITEATRDGWLLRGVSRHYAVLYWRFRPAWPIYTEEDYLDG